MASKTAHGLFLLTLIVLIAFAGNSVLARLALAGGQIDPWSFTAIRLISGAAMLLILTGTRRSIRKGSAAGALWLLVYALLFSLAYVELAAGTGALILFAGVQITMIGGGFLAGERMNMRQVAGLALAICGLLVLMGPSLERPSMSGAAMMTVAGIGWGLYSLKGRSSADALGVTSGNFARAAIVMGMILAGAAMAGLTPEPEMPGVIYALISGVVTSALGYALWYRVLKYLPAIQASVSQLSVPVIAAAGGFIALSEPVTLGFAVSSLMVLSGLGLAALPARSSRDISH